MNLALSILDEVSKPIEKPVPEQAEPSPSIAQSILDEVNREQTVGAYTDVLRTVDPFTRGVVRTVGGLGEMVAGAADAALGTGLKEKLSFTPEQQEAFDRSNTTLPQRLAYGAGQLAGDLPAFVGGSVLAKGLLGKVAPKLVETAKASTLAGKLSKERAIVDAVSAAAGGALAHGEHGPIESGKAAITFGAAGPLSAVPGIKGMVSEAAVLTAIPAIMEGRIPSAEELGSTGAYIAAFRIANKLASAKKASRKTVSDALDIPVKDIPPPLRTQAGRERLVAGAKRAVETSKVEQPNVPLQNPLQNERPSDILDARNAKGVQQERPLASLKYSELKEIAKAEGVKPTGAKASTVSAIEKARQERSLVNEQKAQGQTAAQAEVLTHTTPTTVQETPSTTPTKPPFASHTEPSSPSIRPSLVVRPEIEDAAKTVSSATQTPIHVVKSVSDLPDTIRANVPVDRPVRGVYDRTTGAFYLVDDAIADANEAKSILANQMAARRGSREILGADAGSFYDRVFKSHASDIVSHAESRSMPVLTKHDRRNAAASWLVDKIDSGEISSLGLQWTRARNKARKSLSSVFGREFSDAEIARVMQSSVQSPASGRVRGVSGHAETARTAIDSPREKQGIEGSETPEVRVRNLAQDRLETVPPEVTVAPVAQAQRPKPEKVGKRVRVSEPIEGVGIPVAQEPRPAIAPPSTPAPVPAKAPRMPATGQTEPGHTSSPTTAHTASQTAPGASKPAPAPAPEPAVPSDTPRRSPKSTSTKNAIMELERSTEGRDPIIREVTQTDSDTLAMAWSRIRENPKEGSILAESIVSGAKQSISEVDEAVLLLEKVRLRNARDAVAAKMNDAALSETERNVAATMWDELESQINRIDHATYRGGTIWGRFGQFRQRLLREDYTFEAMERKARAVKGKPLTPDESNKIRELSERIASLEKELETARAASSGQIRINIVEEIDNAIQSIWGKPESKSALLKAAAQKGAKAAEEFTAAAYELLGGGRVGIVPTSPFNPENYKRFKPHFDVAWSELRGAGKDIADFIRLIVGKYGPGVKPYLARYIDDAKIPLAPLEASESSVRAMRSAVASESKGKKAVDVKARQKRIVDLIKEGVKEGDAMEDMRHLVHELALNIVRMGETSREPLITKVRNVLKTIVPGIDRRTVRDLISGYGRVVLLDKEPAKVRLRELKGQMQQLSKIDDMMKSIPPKKTGVERRGVTDEERELIRKVNQLKREKGFVVTDPERQLRTAIDSVKTRLRNEIRDLERAIIEKKPIYGKKRSVLTDGEIEKLKERRAELKAEYTSLFPEKPMSEQQRIQMALKSLDKAIERLESDLRSGKLYRTLKPRLMSPEIKEKRARLEALQNERDALRMLDTETLIAKKEKQLLLAIQRASMPDKPRTNKPTVDSDRIRELTAQLDAIRSEKRARNAHAIALKQYKARLQHAIADLESRLKKGEFEPRARNKPTIKKDDEALNLEFRLNQVKTEFNRQLFEHQIANRLFGHRVYDAIRDGLHLQKAVRSAYDVSGVFRQGGLLTLSHPIKAARSIVPMFRALASEKAEFEYHKRLMARPNAKEYKEVKLFTHDPYNPNLSSMEEAFMSRWANKIPGVPASQRAYTTFLNLLRADVYDSMTATIRGTPADTLEAKKLIANYVNVATGRGSLGTFERAAVALNAAFWSPKLVMSRFQYALGQPLWKSLLDKPTQKDLNAARTIIAKEYSRTLSGMGLILALAASVPGVTVGVNPTSSDFGVITIGKTHIDMLAGLAQTIRFLSRLASFTGDSITSLLKPYGKTKPKRFGEKGAWDVIARFARSKLGPAPSTAVELMSGETYTGEPITRAQMAQNLIVPLGLSDMFESILREGPVKGTILGLMSMFGVGVQYY